MSSSFDLFPDTTRVTLDNHLAIGGVDLVTLATQHGTPLSVYDSATVVARAGAMREALRASYPGTSTLCYSAKAYVAPWLLRLLAQENLGLDVVSGGELHVAARAGFPMERVYVHGHNKSDAELASAVGHRVGRVVVDSLDEIALLGRLAAERRTAQPVLLSLGVGAIGLEMSSGAALAGVRAILALAELDLRGFDVELDARDAETPGATIDGVFAFAAQMRETTGFVLREVSLTVAAATDLPALAGAVFASSTRHGPEQPELTIALGDPIVAPAGVTLRRVVSVKKGAPAYVSVDGPATVGAHPVALASRVEDGGLAEVSVVAAAGEVVIDKATLPLPHVGDLIAVAVAGVQGSDAGGMAPRPAVVVAADGDATLVRSRETYDDLVARDLI